MVNRPDDMEDRPAPSVTHVQEAIGEHPDSSQLNCDPFVENEFTPCADGDTRKEACP